MVPGTVPPFFGVKVKTTDIIKITWLNSPVKIGIYRKRAATVQQSKMYNKRMVTTPHQTTCLLGALAEGRAKNV
jgi:hypothetical protein